MQRDPGTFDMGKKGFLTYEEYVGYSISILRQPLDKKEMGNRIGYSEMRFRKDVVDLEGVFDFFSSGKDHISFDTLRNAVSRLEMEIPDEDVVEMIFLLSPSGKVSRETFADVFG